MWMLGFYCGVVVAGWDRLGVVWLFCSDGLKG